MRMTKEDTNKGTISFQVCSRKLSLLKFLLVNTILTLTLLQDETGGEMYGM